MQGFFRKAAIEKVSSPEQLDLMMQVTSPMGWLALLTVAVLLFVVALWSVFGSIPELVDSRGVLLRGERLSEVTASIAGSVSSIAVAPDTVVKAGQVIAVINRSRASIEEREGDATGLARSQAMVTAKEEEVRSLQAQKVVQEDLVRRGLKAANVLFEFEHRINAARGELNSLEREISSIKARMRITAEITAPEGGRVVEVLKSAGDKISEGEPLIRLETARSGEGERRDFCNGQIHAVLYVPASLAGKVRPGQPARVSPLDVKKEEYGYIEGTVEWVSAYAASPDDMREKLKNEALVQAYNSGGPVFETRACLMPDPSNKVNGFKWSSSSGPDG